MDEDQAYRDAVVFRNLLESALARAEALADDDAADCLRWLARRRRPLTFRLLPLLVALEQVVPGDTLTFKYDAIITPAAPAPTPSPAAGGTDGGPGGCRTPP